MMLPLGFLFIITIMGMFYNPGFDFLGTSPEYSHSTGGFNNSTVDIPGSDPITINLNSQTTILALLSGAIIVAIIAGISVMGSGLSTYSQNTIFVSIIYIGLWGVLSLFASSVVFTNDIMMVLWIILTILYVIGLSGHISGNDTGGD